MKIRFSQKLILFYSLLINIAVLVIGIVIANYLLSSAYHENLNNKQIEMSREAAILNERIERVGLFANTVASMRALDRYARETVHEHTWFEIWQLRSNELVTLNRTVHMYNIIESAIIYISDAHMRPIPPFLLNIADMPAETAPRVDTTVRGQQNFLLRNGAVIDSGPFDQWVFYFTHRDLRGNFIWVLEVSVDISQLFYYVISEGESLFLLDGNIIIHSNESYSFLLAEQMMEPGQFYIYGCDERVTVWSPLQFLPDTQIARMYYTAEINSQLIEIRRLIIVSLVVLIAIFTGFIWLVTKIMLRRLNVVINAMRRVEEGDIFFIAPSTVDDEISIMTDGFNRMMDNLLSYFSISIRRQAAAKDAEIQALLSQINSHFLYNILDSFKSMAEINYNYELADAIVAFAKITRYNVDKVRRHTTMADEIDYIANYVTLVNLRKENAIDYKCVVDESLMQEKILKMIVQPFIENSLTHGFVDFDTKRYTLLLKITKQNEKLHIFIADNGIGMDEIALNKIRQYFAQAGADEQIDETVRKSVGIKNTCHRIKLEYGDSAEFDIRSKVGCYTTVLISIDFGAN